MQSVGPVTVNGNATNSFIRGLSKGEITKFGGFDKNLMEIKIRARKVKFNGTYAAKSRVLGIPINGGGPYKALFSE